MQHPEQPAVNQRQAEDNQTLLTYQRSVLEMHSSLYVNLTELAQDIHNVEKGDTVDVHVRSDGVIEIDVN